MGAQPLEYCLQNIDRESLASRLTLSAVLSPQTPMPSKLLRPKNPFDMATRIATYVIYQNSADPDGVKLGRPKLITTPEAELITLGVRVGYTAVREELNKTKETRKTVRAIEKGRLVTFASAAALTYAVADKSAVAEWMGDVPVLADAAANMNELHSDSLNEPELFVTNVASGVQIAFAGLGMYTRRLAATN